MAAPSGVAQEVGHDREHPQHQKGRNRYASVDDRQDDARARDRQQRVDKYISNLLDDDYGLGVTVTTGPDNLPAIKITLYGSSIREGGDFTVSMVITDSQAKELKLDPAKFYDTQEVHDVRMTLKKQGSTSKWKVDDLATYLNIGGGYFTKNDMPLLAPYSIDVQGNIRQEGNMFFPVLYINNGKIRFIIPLPESDNLGNTVETIRSSDPELINKLISEEYVKRKYRKIKQ